MGIWGSERNLLDFEIIGVFVCEEWYIFIAPSPVHKAECWSTEDS